MTRHELPATPATMRWGTFDGSFPPVLTVEDGDEVTIHSLSGAPEDLPSEGSGLTVRDALREAHAGLAPGLAAHMLTGPVAVRGAKPGDALRVEILDVRLADDWGYNAIKPLRGTLADDYGEVRRIHLPLDREAGTIATPWGMTIPARPFFGVMGTAPPRAWGPQTSIVPRAFGGNIDLKELTAGATLDLPVFEPGGLLSVGDGHAAQGDGEVCLTAVETGLTGRLRLSILPGAGLARPRAETATHLIAMGFHEDLDDAAVIALREMIALLGERAGLAAEDAYRACSLAADLRVTQLVNGHKGIHAMFPKSLLGRPG